jgi:hypothetical protein
LFLGRLRPGTCRRSLSHRGSKGSNSFGFPGHALAASFFIGLRQSNRQRVAVVGKVATRVPRRCRASDPPQARAKQGRCARIQRWRPPS